jgi:membrane protein YqaA with SNARE-associated domain
MIKSAYKKCIDLASHKSSKFFLAVVSFMESSFFPIPPDVMIVPMIIAKKNDFKKIFFIATFFSVLGGIFGYFLGFIFIEFANQIISFYGYEDKILELRFNLSQGDGFYAWFGILFLAGFTPLPYKAFTIASGFVSFNLGIFILVSLISRGLRFFIISYLTFKFGSSFDNFMNLHGAKWFTILGVIIMIIAGIIIFI